MYYIYCCTSCRRPIDIALVNSLGPLDRLDCSVKEYPPRLSTPTVGQRLLDSLRNMKFIIPSQTFSSSSGIIHYTYQYLIIDCLVNGFCDYETTSDPKYGNYTWTESVGGTIIRQQCTNKPSAFVVRQCFPNNDGWSDIDFTKCKTSMLLCTDILSIMNLLLQFIN